MDKLFNRKIKIGNDEAILKQRNLSSQSKYTKEKRETKRCPTL